MAAYPMEEVLASILRALSGAQRESDLYSQSLYQEGVEATETDILPVPWAQLNTANLALRFAIASIDVPDPTSPKESKADLPSDLPQVMVYVTAEDLTSIDPKEISTLNIDIDVNDQEYVKTEDGEE